MKTPASNKPLSSAPAWFLGSSSQWGSLRSQWSATQRVARWIQPLRQTHRSMGVGAALSAITAWLFWSPLGADFLISVIFASLAVLLTLLFIGSPALVSRLRSAVSARERDTRLFCEGLARLGALDRRAPPPSARRRSLEACVQDALIKTQASASRFNALAIPEISATDERGRPVKVEIIDPPSRAR